jgi:hypothetical protein
MSVNDVSTVTGLAHRFPDRLTIPDLSGVVNDALLPIIWTPQSSAADVCTWSSAARQKATSPAK